MPEGVFKAERVWQVCCVFTASREYFESNVAFYFGDDLFDVVCCCGKFMSGDEFQSKAM